MFVCANSILPFFFFWLRVFNFLTSTLKINRNPFMDLEENVHVKVSRYSLGTWQDSAQFWRNAVCSTCVSLVVLWVLRFWTTSQKHSMCNALGWTVILFIQGWFLLKIWFYYFNVTLSKKTSFTNYINCIICEKMKFSQAVFENLKTTDSGDSHAIMMLNITT